MTREIKELNINWELLNECNYIGMRGEDRLTYSIGGKSQSSYDWDYENDCSSFLTTGQQLPGTCAMNLDIDMSWGVEEEEVIEAVKAAYANFSYYGDVYILGSRSVTYGADGNEIIMENAVVIGTVK